MILITGASGYLGRALCANLIAADSPIVSAGRSIYHDDRVEHRALDLSRSAGVRDALAGATTVIHCAGVAHNKGALADYDNINVRASMALADAAVAQGVKRFIYLSSLNVVPADAPDPQASAASFPQPSERYAASKWRAEQQLEALVAYSNTELVLVRPALIYDRDLTANLATLSRLAHLMPFVLPDVGHRSMISRSDLVALLTHLVSCSLGTNDSGVHQLAVTDGQLYSAERISRAFAKRTGWPLPKLFWRAASAIWDWRVGGAQGATWSSIASPHWTGTVKPVDGWRPAVTLESLFGDVGDIENGGAAP